MQFPRSSGLLLHPTSLPSATGVGELGPAAYAFVDFLEKAGQKLWQVLPLGPTGYGNSPYACYSAFAGNPFLISLDALVQQGLLKKEGLEPLAQLPKDHVDFGKMWEMKEKLLNEAFQTFRREATPSQRQALVSYCEAPLVSLWLEDYALFMALKQAHEGQSWTDWEPVLKQRDPGALRHVQDQLGEQIWFQRFMQWVFDSQWSALRRYAHEKGIKIVGDIPIYVAHDSADVWSQPHMFFLDGEGNSTVVAGVPPDYFSETGQLWGNPLYRWDFAERSGYTWWIHRFRVLFSRVDRVRLDHFRGFEAYWEVPAAEKTAINGRWVKGPGKRMFQAVERALGVMPIIAEDLGIITPEVEALRDTFDFPGMKILQFAFGGDEKNPYLPHNYIPNSVVYTGTHDNDTLVGWLRAEKPEVLEKLWAYVGKTPEGVPAAEPQAAPATPEKAPEAAAVPAEAPADSAKAASDEPTEKPQSTTPQSTTAQSTGHPLAWDVIRLAMASVSSLCILPVQDVLELGTDARMNTPSSPEGNWTWRYQEGTLTDALAEKLRALTVRYNRVLPVTE